MCCKKSVVCLTERDECFLKVLSAAKKVFSAASVVCSMEDLPVVKKNVLLQKNVVCWKNLLSVAGVVCRKQELFAVRKSSLMQASVV